MSGAALSITGVFVDTFKALLKVSRRQSPARANVMVFYGNQKRPWMSPFVFVVPVFFACSIDPVLH
jgi:hypothetical protein